MAEWRAFNAIGKNRTWPYGVGANGGRRCGWFTTTRPSGRITWSTPAATGITVITRFAGCALGYQFGARVAELGQKLVRKEG